MLTRLFLPLAPLAVLALAPAAPRAPIQDAAGPAAAPATALPHDPPILRVGDEEVRRSELDDFLLEKRGNEALAQFVRRRLVQSEARRRGLWPDSERVASEVQARASQRVQRAFGGDWDAWRRETEMLGATELGFRRRRAVEVASELALDALVAADRQATEADLRGLWEREYGIGGRRLHVTRLVLPVRVPPVEGRTTPEARRERSAQVREETLELARRLARELAGAADPEALARRERLELFVDVPFDPYAFGPAVTDTFYAQPIGEFGEPVFSLGSVHVARVERVVERPFEEVEAALRERWLNRPTSRAESQAVIGRLEAETAIDVRLAARLSERRHDMHHPERPVVLLGDEAVPFSDYLGELRRLHADKDVTQFIELWVMQREAERLGVLPTDEAIEARIEADIERRVTRLFNGNRGRFESELQRQGLTLETFREGKRRRARHELCIEGILVARRTSVPEDVVRGLWHERYGVDGRLFEARMIRFDFRPPLVGTEDIQGYRTKELARLRVRADEVRERLADGEDFAELARRHSDDPNSRAAGGRIPGGLRPDRWPANIVAAVEDLEDGETSAILAYGPNLVIVQRLSEAVTPFESVRESLEEEIRSRRSSAAELTATAAEVLRDVEWERLPAFGR